MADVSTKVYWTNIYKQYNISDKTNENCTSSYNVNDLEAKMKVKNEDEKLWLVINQKSKIDDAGFGYLQQSFSKTTVPLYIL